MRHNPERANPIMLALLAIPMLMVFGVSKGCQAVHETLAEPARTEDLAPAVRSYRIESAQPGWRI